MSSVRRHTSNMRLVAENDELTIRLSALAALTEESAGSADEYLRVYRELLGRIEQEAVSESHTGIYELCQYYKQAIDALISNGGFPQGNTRRLLSQWPGLVLDYLASPDDREVREVLIDHIRHPDLTLPISDGDAAILNMMLDESSPIPAGDGDESHTGDGSGMSLDDMEIILDEQAMDPAALQTNDAVEITIEDSVDQDVAVDDAIVIPEGEVKLPSRELIGTLLNQLKVMQEPLEKLSKALSSDPRSNEDIVSATEVLAGYLQRFSEASGEIGLSGLQSVSRRAVNNLLAWSQVASIPATSAAGLVNKLFDGMKSYLLAPYSMAKAKGLVEALCDSEWPDPLMSGQVQNIVGLFLNAPLEEPEELVIEPEPEEVEQEQESKRPKVATAEDVSLAIPDDVDDELFEIMLEELPEQTEQFSAAVQNLIAGGTQEDVKVAQRMAHSLKGAGNTIGIKGVANLTHHMEDILIQFSEQGALPTRALSMTMMNVVDCLEAMGESLNGDGETPPEAQAVLQEVLDWANRIDREGLPAEDDSINGMTPSVGMEALPDSGLADSLSVSTESSGLLDSLSSGPLSANSAMNALSDSMVSDSLSQSGAMRALSDSISGMQALAAGQRQKRRSNNKEASSSTVRVPASLVDNLLRLAGEATIMTGLMRERVRQTIAQVQNLQNEFHRMHTLGAELERLVDIKDFSNTQQGNANSEFDALEMDQYSELHTHSRMLAETATDSQQLGYQVKQELMGLEDMLVDQDLLNKESQNAVMDVRMVPAKTIVSKLQRSVRQTSRLTNKQVRLQVNGEDTQMDGDVLSELADPLMHILRNAIDHGIEASEKRIQLGKPEEGTIELGFFREGNSILIRCRDDGAGINYDAIQRKAESLGILEPGKKASEDELKRILLLSNFSTRDEVTQTSGRGVGMDAVYAKIIEIGGSLALESETGVGTLFELRVPLTLVTSHALLVRQGPSLLAISDHGVLQILHGQDGALEEEDDAVYYRVGDNRYPARFLESIMDLPPDRRASDRSKRPVFLVQDEMGVSAVIVGEVLESLNIVIKDFGKYVANLPGIAGAAILGDGSVKPVVDLPELLHHARLAHMPMVMVPERTEAPKPDRVMVMVVDDSRSARYVLSKAIERAGYIVRPAHDGMEALKLLESRPADIVLSDMEMPRMNGIELTEHMRMSGQLADIPVIMITSRSTKKHREEAEAAGVNDYFTKPFDEEALVKAVEKLLQKATVST